VDEFGFWGFTQMNTKWSLDALYPSFESREFHEDFAKCKQEIAHLREWVQSSVVDQNEPMKKMETYITQLNALSHLLTRLLFYSKLTVSTDAKNTKALQMMEKLEDVATEFVEPAVSFQKWVGSLPNLEKLIDSSDLLQEHRFYLHELAKHSIHLLSQQEEVVISKLQTTGSSAWSKLQELLTSTLLIELSLHGKEEKLPLSLIRNMAYEKDAETRKKAYSAELAAYKKIEESSAASLNGIKGEVITLAKLRGYSSPLEMTLTESRMDLETLEAMLAAIKESLPVFGSYYRKKAELLGHKDGLPFYDLFAPMGDLNMRFTYDEARKYIVTHFRSFSDRLADFANHAFENRWIDAEPREGKQGGAFCENLHVIKESRILANFTGSFNDVTTLAHELGHGYHGECLTDESYLNSNYPMPIAETASIFCETIIKNAVLKTATEQEMFTILENDIADAGQIIVDIYSRYLFESELFKRREDSSLSVDELKEIMVWAQKQAYGDGLNPNALHPYMWACKPHYYDAHYNFYNFPYAFGLLFAKGLYAEYLKKGSSFISQYDQLLSVTGKLSIADVARRMDVDVHSIDFWRSSLKLVERDIQKFISIS
jgi:pepF/M3 family oligoendopeptidase